MSLALSKWCAGEGTGLLDAEKLDKERCCQRRGRGTSGNVRGRSPEKLASVARRYGSFDGSYVSTRANLDTLFATMVEPPMTYARAPKGTPVA